MFDGICPFTPKDIANTNIFSKWNDFKNCFKYKTSNYRHSTEFGLALILNENTVNYIVQTQQ